MRQKKYKYPYCPLYFNRGIGYWITNVDGKPCPVHRVAMMYYLNRSLDRRECVHHRNGDKTNNAQENLQVTTKRVHHLFHEGRRYIIPEFGPFRMGYTVEIYEPYCRVWYSGTDAKCESYLEHLKYSKSDTRLKVIDEKQAEKFTKGR